MVKPQDLTTFFPVNCPWFAFSLKSCKQIRPESRCWWKRSVTSYGLGIDSKPWIQFEFLNPLWAVNLKPWQLLVARKSAKSREQTPSFTVTPFGPVSDRWALAEKTRIGYHVANLYWYKHRTLLARAPVKWEAKEERQIIHIEAVSANKTNANQDRFWPEDLLMWHSRRWDRYLPLALCCLNNSVWLLDSYNTIGC